MTTLSLGTAVHHLSSVAVIESLRIEPGPSSFIIRHHHTGCHHPALFSMYQGSFDIVAYHWVKPGV